MELRSGCLDVRRAQTNYGRSARAKSRTFPRSASSKVYSVRHTRISIFSAFARISREAAGISTASISRTYPRCTSPCRPAFPTGTGRPSARKLMSWQRRYVQSLFDTRITSDAAGRAVAAFPENDAPQLRFRYPPACTWLLAADISVRSLNRSYLTTSSARMGLDVSNAIAIHQHFTIALRHYDFLVVKPVRVVGVGASASSPRDFDICL